MVAHAGSVQFSECGLSENLTLSGRDSRKVKAEFSTDNKRVLVYVVKVELEGLGVEAHS